MSGKSEKFTRAAGVGGQFADLADAIMWARIGREVAGGTWLIRREDGQWRVYSPSERARELQTS